ncbi:MAG: hypothetical protein JHD16_10345 [Solirubrobacteraceae bacterium]|nr:hypothetical protein [Solirubrobacteraceae bacterium]
MSGAGTPAVAMLVALVVVLAGLVGLIDVPNEAYAGLVLVLLGLGLLAWGREGEA